MVHRKYIKIGKKIYGPYYYESYREDGKIKKRYIKAPIGEGIVKSRVKRIGRGIFGKNLLIVYFIFLAFLLILTINRYTLPIPFVKEGIQDVELLFSPLGASTGFNGNANLSIWDDTDLGENRFSGIRVNFYANYTSNSGAVIDSISGNCQIRYNFTGVYEPFENMIYNSSSLMWESNRTFNYKGIHSFEVSCTSSFGDITLSNLFVISNSAPDIFETPGGFIDLDGNILNNDVFMCSEDSLCFYNLSANTTDSDINDVLNFNYIVGANSTLTNFSINQDTGILTINVTNDVNTGVKNIELTVVDNDGARDTGILVIDISAVNDPPVFTNLNDIGFNRSFLFEDYIIVTDEENNIPFVYNISFLSCQTAQWSDRGNTNCDLFNSTQYTINTTNYLKDDVLYIGGSINISFIPSRNDVGDYRINFSVGDFGGANASMAVNFTVLNINENPNLTYVCDNERSTFEDTNFNCYINASDIDEINNLTFSSNLPWFLDSNSTKVNVTTNFEGSILVNFKPSDINVGNWSINVTVKDTGNPAGLDSRKFWFFVDNINDSVNMQNLGSVSAFTSNNYYAVYFNATDDDLLISDKGIYNEVLTFSSNASWATVRTFGVISNSNRTVGIIEFDPNNAPSSGIHKINISVIDANGYSVDSKILTIDIAGNSKPQWIDPPTNQILTENVSYYINLSNYVVDADGDFINFSYIVDFPFAGFSLDSETGVINFTPDDIDIGGHNVTINASDGKTPSPMNFNFTVINVNDLPSIGALQGNNFTSSDNGAEIGVMEDDFVQFSFFVTDDDLRILVSQKSFYNEVFKVNMTLQGPNSNLFDFVQDAEFVSGPGTENKLLFKALFTPQKADIGNYTVSVNISDASNASSLLSFNLSVKEINHYPVLMELEDQASTIDRNLYYDINATDVEDGDDNEGNLTFSYVFLGDGDADSFINEDEGIFNSTSGVLNVTFVQSQGGRYHLNITVNDSTGLQDSGDFWVYVIDLPEIIFPLNNFVFNLKEGVIANLSFIATSSPGFNISYLFYINEAFRGEVDNYYGNGTKLIWQALPDYVDETYGLLGNLSLVAAITGYEFLNSSKDWGANISHGNAPVSFIKNIGDKQGIYGKDILIDLREHFSDVDAFDLYYNQSVQFIVSSNSTLTAIAYNVNGSWTLALSASGPVVEYLKVKGTDFYSNGSAISNATSNIFEVEFTDPLIVPQPVPVPVPVPVGGAGGSQTEKLVSFKIILPGPISARRGEVVNLPIQLVNDGHTALHGIDLLSLIVKDGKVRDAGVTFDRSSIADLPIGGRENLTMSFNASNDLGFYEITINATVKDPKYFDWGKIFINVEEGDTIVERLLFTEEFIVQNPECIELKEVVDESKRYLSTGDFANAQIKIDEAINSCKSAISQQSLISRNRIKAKFQDNVFLYLLITTIISVILGIAFYLYRMISLKKSLNEIENADFEKV